MLILGFSDGHSFLPVDFALLSGSSKVGKDAPSDKRTSGGIRAKEAQMTSPKLVVEMVARALSSGIYASHV
ncbi:hypothetical protein [Enterococcus sp. AZ194]|uniref:hypothetical protein n=1 Tax=Enterococcus sp. AZ194 TaxID=2774629 RepID=UPI003F688258